MSKTRLLEMARDFKSTLIGLSEIIKKKIIKNDSQRETNGEVVLLSLGGRFGFPMLAKALVDMGFTVHVLSKKVPGHELRYAQKWHRVDCLGDRQELIKVIEGLKVVGIFSEMKNVLLPIKADLQEHFGLRSIGSFSSSASNSKLKFREAIDEANVNNLIWEVFKPLENSLQSFPFVIKPEVGTGSRGVHMIRTESELTSVSNELLNRKKSVLFDGSLLTEQYIEGRQFDVEGISRDGVHYPLTLTEEKYEQVGDLFPSLWYLFSPPVSRSMDEKIKNFAKQILNALSVKNGAWHCEIRIDENGGLYPIDFSNRMGYPRMVTETCGHNFLDLYVRTLLPSNFELPELQHNTVYQRFLKNERERRIFSKLESENPEVIIEFRKLTTMIAEVPRFGRVSIKSENYESLSTLLKKYDVKPTEWDHLYREK